MCPPRVATLDIVKVSVRRAPLALGLLTNMIPRVALANVKSDRLSISWVLVSEVSKLKLVKLWRTGSPVTPTRRPIECIV